MKYFRKKYARKYKTYRRKSYRRSVSKYRRPKSSIKRLVKRTITAQKQLKKVYIDIDQVIQPFNVGSCTISRLLLPILTQGNQGFFIKERYQENNNSVACRDGTAIRPSYFGLKLRFVVNNPQLYPQWCVRARVVIWKPKADLGFAKSLQYLETWANTAERQVCDNFDPKAVQILHDRIIDLPGYQGWKYFNYYMTSADLGKLWTYKPDEDTAWPDNLNQALNQPVVHIFAESVHIHGAGAEWDAKIAYQGTMKFFFRDA